MNQKGFTVIIILLVIVVVAFVGLAYFVGTRNISQNAAINALTPMLSSTPQSSVNENLNWKTFQSKLLGIEVKIPQNFQTYEQKVEGEYSPGTKSACVRISTDLKKSNIFAINICLLNNPTRNTLEYFKAEGETKGILNGYNYYKDDISQRIIFESSERNIVEFSPMFFDNTTISIYNQMLSAFRFTN